MRYPHYFTRFPTYFISFCLIFLLSNVASSNEQDEKRKLEQLKTQIQDLQKQLKEDNQEKDQAVFLLQGAEKEVAAASRKLRKIQSDYSKSQHKLSQLKNNRKELLGKLGTNRELLVSQLRAAYSIGKQEYIKLLLNQENPGAVSRMVTYYQYFSQSRAEKLESINARLEKINNVSRQIQTQSEKLYSLKELAASESTSLKEKRNKRTEVVASISASLREKNKALNSLLRDEQHLKKLLNRIESQLNDVQLDLEPPKDFRDLKGQLLWPTTGRISARFGSIRNKSGNLKWKGIVIDTEAGNNVKAVAYGRVVFADWLRGFGMLLIIDHGDGYMSLYGHNEQLHKNIGDWIQSGEIIATSGKSGGQLATSLYFEIRHNGKPQDPLKWCKSLPRRS